MRTIEKNTLEWMRKQYPAGCRVELVSMNDPQAPPSGTQGTVLIIDDAGTIHVNWDDGSGLGVAYGADICRRIE